MSKKLTLIAGVLALVLSAASAFAADETWAGEGDGNIAQTVITPLRYWQADVNYYGSIGIVTGNWICGTYGGTFSGVRYSNGSFTGSWLESGGYSGTLDGTFVDTDSDDEFDTVSGTWVVTEPEEAEGSGDWWGERTD